MRLLDPAQKFILSMLTTSALTFWLLGSVVADARANALEGTGVGQFNAPSLSGLTECSSKSDNLLMQTNFAQVEGQRYAWRSSQHSSKSSFQLAVTDGVLAITQAASEPWFVFKQSVDVTNLGGKYLQFSAEMRGNIEVDPKLHGFEHKAGLYFRVTTSDRERQSFSGDQKPNTGDWDWQPFASIIEAPLNILKLEVGFFHQAGGVLYAKNPSLVILECPE